VTKQEEHDERQTWEALSAPAGTLPARALKGTLTEPADRILAILLGIPTPERKAA
jgi:hypothetical protein